MELRLLALPYCCNQSHLLTLRGLKAMGGSDMVKEECQGSSWFINMRSGWEG